MTSHPYRAQPDSAFWSRAITDGFASRDLVQSGGTILRRDDRVVSAGSCFASNLVPWLERSGITYIRTETVHPLFADTEEHLGYRNFSAAYGNVYTARHLRQLLERATGAFAPVEDRWYVGDHVIDPFRPGLRFPARSDDEFDLLTAQHLAAVRSAFEQATVFFFTLGLTEAWVSVADGAAFPACPGVVAGAFDPTRHAFHNFTVAETVADVEGFVQLLRGLNPTVRVILTVSPVPLVATATSDHVLTATTYSKAVLRAAAGELAAKVPGVSYFPAYEIVTGPQAPADFFLANRRDVSETAVVAVMEALLAGLSPPVSPTPSVGGETAERSPSAAVSGVLSRRIAEAECDEVLADI